MKNLLKKIFTVIICIPIVLLCSCGGGEKPTCKEISSLSYYYGNSISCDIFYQSEKKTINTSSIINSKLNKDMLDKYAQFTLTAKSAEIYHLYIEYIYFKVYTNGETDIDSLVVELNLTNVIDESNVGKTDLEESETKFSNTYDGIISKKGGTIIFKAKVMKTVATATGSTLNINISHSDVYADENTKFKWCIYDFKIYGESRSY